MRRAKICNFVFMKKNKSNNNIKFKEKGNRTATCYPVKGKLISLFRSGRSFSETGNLYKNLIHLIKVLRPVTEPFLFCLNFQKTKV
jgi:hypothetical protein